MNESKEVYRLISSMEPLMPEPARCKAMEAVCQEILQESARLEESIYAERTRREVVDLIREMNCYYSNLIEGSRTRPKDIERALRNDFSTKKKEREKQILALAHIRAEKMLDHQIQDNRVEVWDLELVRGLHRELYKDLPEDMHFSERKDGSRYRVIPGEIRDYMVEVGTHTPPDHEALSGYMDRFFSVYRASARDLFKRLIVLAASHHRLLWIHPFGDGNGRVARLFSHALMIRFGVRGLGLWNISRGLARCKSRYYELLEEADRPRQGDVDGRGNLSQKALTDFCEFFLDTMLDQIRFMRGLLKPECIEDGIEDFCLRKTDVPEIRKQGALYACLLKEVYWSGSLERGKAKDVLRVGATKAAEMIRLLADKGLIASDTPKGPVHLQFPEEVLSSYFPELYLPHLRR